MRYSLFASTCTRACAHAPCFLNTRRVSTAHHFTVRTIVAGIARSSARFLLCFFAIGSPLSRFCISAATFHVIFLWAAAYLRVITHYLPSPPAASFLQNEVSLYRLWHFLRHFLRPLLGQSLRRRKGGVFGKTRRNVLRLAVQQPPDPYVLREHGGWRKATTHRQSRQNLR